MTTTHLSWVGAQNHKVKDYGKKRKHIFFLNLKKKNLKKGSFYEKAWKKQICLKWC